MSIFKMEEPLDNELYSILACPSCKADVRYTYDQNALVCLKCRRKYPIQDGIPIMMPDAEVA
jgi:uncharacterized protein